MDELRPIVLGLSNPFEGHGMVLCDVAALHENRSAVLQIDPVIGHGSAAECCPQTGDGGTMSKSRLVLDVGCSKQTRCFLEEIALFIRVLCAAHERDRVGAVNWDIFTFEFFSGDPCLVARRVDFLCNSIDRVLP